MNIALTDEMVGRIAGDAELQTALRFDAWTYLTPNEPVPEAHHFVIPKHLLRLLGDKPRTKLMRGLANYFGRAAFDAKCVKPGRTPNILELMGIANDDGTPSASICDQYVRASEDWRAGKLSKERFWNVMNAKKPGAY